MKTIFLLTLTAATIWLIEPAGAAEITLESAPPVVVKTVPVAGATDVDPGLTELRVTFSKAMQDGSWSWSTWGQENYPETTGKPRYLADARTCVLPVKLEPNRFYAIWLNSDKFQNFKDTGGRPAVPYLLTFFTGGSLSGGVSAPATSVTSSPAIWLREAGIDLAKVDVQTAPLTQVMIEELQADGNSRFRGVIRSVNRSDESQTRLQFINSDHIELQRMVDAEGNTIPFTATHADRIFRYSATLPKPVPPGGTLLYASEGVARNKVNQNADLGTFTYRFTHSPASGVPTRRVEVHRLPPGAEVLEVSANATKRERNGRMEIVLDEIVQPRGSVTLAYRYRLADAKAGVSAEVKRVVEAAVTTISGCAEGDPRVEAALKSLRPLDQAQVVSALMPHLDKAKDTERRSAIYILWKGGFANITPAIAPLQELLTHPEDLTRGMAALALGQNKAGASLELLMKMAREDNSGYARRCAAYALGLLGDERAEPALKAALHDTEAMVRNNAQAALDLLKATKSSSPPPAKSSDASAAIFSPVVETVLKSPERRVAELLDLDTGRRATSTSFGENDRETHAWIREHKLELLGVVERGQIAVLCSDMVVPPAPAKSFDSLTAGQVRTNWHLAQGEPNKITALSPATDQTDTWYFRTREDGYGILQILGENADPPGVTIRYKLVQTSTGSGAGVSDTFLPLLNDDQRAVLAWTDRQFRSFFDARTFDGWSDEERAALEIKLMDALNGPRSTEYYQAINSLAALRSTQALPRLREIAYDRADKNNRDRWMAIRALGMIGEKADVPELIHLVYHGNVNTRWWAQISLVRITGKNFAKDWNAWGKWWNDQDGQPPYKTEIIHWWNGQPEPDKLAENLDEGDEKFLTGVRGKSAATAAPSSGELAVKLRAAAPTTQGIRSNWSAAVAAINADDATNALVSLRQLTPHIQKFCEVFRDTPLEAGAVESLALVGSLGAALERGDQPAVQSALAKMLALGRNMEEQVKAINDPVESVSKP